MRELGFTIVELIVTILVAGILAAVALPRWFGDTGFEGRKLRDETVAALRLAQKTAIAARRTVCATFGAGRVAFSITATFGEADCNSLSTTALMSPGGGALAVAGERGATFNGPPAVPLIFDAAGRPSVSATFTVNGLANLPINVEAETGYVH